MPFMAKKTDTNDKAEVANRQIGIRLPAHISQALDRFIADQRIPPTHTETVVTAIREFLEREGYLKKAD